MNPLVMVTGSRDWTDEATIEHALANAYTSLGSRRESILMTGACPTGADMIASSLWRTQGLEVIEFPANWKLYGRSAGPIRNKQMIDFKPSIVLAFPLGESRGTRGTIKMAQDAGLILGVYEG